MGWRRCVMLVVLLAALLPCVAGAADSSALKIRLHDLELQDQSGRTLRFGSDVIADRIVAIAFTYTTCTTICPVLDSILVNLQRRLGDRLGREVQLVTLSIDPVNDTPARLLAHAGKLKARPGWTFLTGRKENMDRVLTGLDMYTADIRNHQPSIIIGDGRRGVWRRYYSFPSADTLLAGLNELAAARKQARP